MKFYEYPKMIYKGGDRQGEHCIVNNYDEEMIQMEIWGDKRPDRILKNDSLLVKVEKPVENEEKVAANSEKEVKPRRKKAVRKKKASSKKSEG